MDGQVVRLRRSGDRPIEPSGSWFPPKFPSFSRKKANDLRTRVRVVLDLFSNFKRVRSSAFSTRFVDSMFSLGFSLSCLVCTRCRTRSVHTNREHDRVFGTSWEQIVCLHGPKVAVAPFPGGANSNSSSRGARSRWYLPACLLTARTLLLKPAFGKSALFRVGASAWFLSGAFWICLQLAGVRLS